MEKKMETIGIYRRYIGMIVVCWGYIGIMEKKTGTTLTGLYMVQGLGYWDYTGRMEKTMETTIMGYILGIIGYILGYILWYREVAVQRLMTPA